MESISSADMTALVDGASSLLARARDLPFNEETIGDNWLMNPILFKKELAKRRPHSTREIAKAFVLALGQLKKLADAMHDLPYTVPRERQLALQPRARVAPLAPEPPPFEEPETVQPCVATAPKSRSKAPLAPIPPEDLWTMPLGRLAVHTRDRFLAQVNFGIRATLIYLPSVLLGLLSTTGVACCCVLLMWPELLLLIPMWLGSLVASLVPMYLAYFTQRVTASFCPGLSSAVGAVSFSVFQSFQQWRQGAIAPTPTASHPEDSMQNITASAPPVSGQTAFAGFMCLLIYALNPQRRVGGGAV